MNSGDIAFPHLGIHLTNVPKGITVFGTEIAFYGMIIALAFLIGIWFAGWLGTRNGLKSEVVWDFSLYGIVSAIVGARAYYVAFEWDYYKNHLLSIFKLREGGLAIYGGVILTFIFAAVFCKVKKVSFLQLADSFMPSLIFGQAIGRWGNFFNREVFGEYTDNLLAMRLPIADVRSRDITAALASHIGEGENFIQVHPTFLYESLCNLTICVILLLWFKRRKFQGELVLIYMAGYGACRFVIEGIRTDTLFVPGTSIPVSQVVAAVMVIGAVILEIAGRIAVKKGKLPAYEYAPYVEDSKSDAGKSDADQSDAGQPDADQPEDGQPDNE